MVEVERQVCDFEIIEMLVGELFSSWSSDAIVWNYYGALEYGISCIMPFAPVIAHEEGAIWVQMYTVYVKALFFLLFKELL
jgi:hypothetical protein